jgi:peptidoglycan hydrolase CwlO-like protein
MKTLWVLILVAGWVFVLQGQSSRYGDIHNEVKRAQSELDDLKKAVHDVHIAATQCDDCDEVQAVVGHLDGPLENLESHLNSIELESLK